MDQMLIIIKDSMGTVIDVGMQNDKGYRKSLENDQLWSLHQDTGRLIPYSDRALLSVSRHERWYEAVLDGAARGHTTAAGSQDQGRAQMAQMAQMAPEMDGQQQAASDAGFVLDHLAQVIAARHRELPEGSYTTHLFNSGEEKIRKKTGEEAVELILARNPQELTSEAADLIYHLLVLLEVLEIPLQHVMDELKRRSG